MEKSFDKKLKVKIDKDKQSVSLSIRVSDDMVTVVKTTINEFNIMIAEYEGQLYEAHQEDSVENEII
jgi:hypothetical protein